MQACRARRKQIEYQVRRQDRWLPYLASWPVEEDWADCLKLSSKLKETRVKAGLVLQLLELQDSYHIQYLWNWVPYIDFLYVTLPWGGGGVSSKRHCDVRRQKIDMCVAPKCYSYLTISLVDTISSDTCLSADPPAGNNYSAVSQEWVSEAIHKHHKNLSIYTLWRKTSKCTMMNR